jgi:hypothetical protein
MKKGLSVVLLCALIMGTLLFVAPSINSGQAFAHTTVRTRYRRHKRTFWQKHRDKLLAGTTAGGAGISTRSKKAQQSVRWLVGKRRLVHLQDSNAIVTIDDINRRRLWGVPRGRRFFDCGPHGGRPYNKIAAFFYCKRKKGTN